MTDEELKRLIAYGRVIGGLTITTTYAMSTSRGEKLSVEQAALLTASIRHLGVLARNLIDLNGIELTELQINRTAITAQELFTRDNYNYMAEGGEIPPVGSIDPDDGIPF